MKRPQMCVVAVLGLCLVVSSACATIVYNDGGTHEINTDVGRISVYDSSGGAPTTVKMLAGGNVGEVDVFQNSRFIMLDGKLGSGLYLHDYSQGEVSGGIVNEDPFALWDFSRLTITGGSVSEGLICNGNCQVFIYGSNFKIDDEPVGYGPLRAGGGLLTGDLLNGGQIRTGLSVNGDAVITLVPEPGTILLLGLGGLALLRKRRALRSSKCEVKRAKSKEGL